MKDFMKEVLKDVKGVIEYTSYLVTILLALGVIAWLLFGTVALLSGSAIALMGGL